MIYGVSSKFNFGRWEHAVYNFDDEITAERWLRTEEYDFRERELMSESKAVRLAGKAAVKNTTKVIINENGELEYINPRC